MRKSLAERFEERTCPEPNTGCLLWAAGATSQGYGSLRAEGRVELATRVAFFLQHGRWPEHRLLSTCRTLWCVEAAHLVEATPGRVKPCIKCGSTDRSPPKGRAGVGNCRPCNLRRATTHYRADPVAAAARRRQGTYGIAPEEQWALFDAQEGRCANTACRAPLDFRRAHLDHDHRTGAVRGFLCNGCNTALGGARDDVGRLRGLVEYLVGIQNHTPSI